MAGPTEVEALAAAQRLVPPAARDALSLERQARYRWTAPLVAGRSVLDAGCGFGWGTALLAEGARRAVGVDISPPAVAAAERDHGDVAEFREGDLRRLPFPDGEFEVVACFETIERVADPELALSELRRVLAPDGVLLISAVNRDAYPPGNPFHLHELSTVELGEAVGRHFTNVEVHRQHGYQASLLASELALSLADGAPVPAVEVAKAAATRPGDELYAVALASDAELPTPSAQLVLGIVGDDAEQRRLLDLWRRRAVAAEVELGALRHELEVARRREPS